MPPPLVLQFLIDAENIEKFAQHGLTDRQVDQVLQNPYLIIDNRKRRRAPYLIIGEDNGGQCVTIPIEPTDDPVLWRPVTAWPCKVSEYNQLRRTRSRG